MAEKAPLVPGALAPDRQPDWGRPRLARLDAAVRDLGNQVFGRAAVSTFEHDGKPLIWRWLATAAPPGAPALTLVCNAGELRCALAIEADDGPALDDSIALDAFDGAALLSAATVRYAAVLSHLERIGGRRLDVTELRRGADPLDAQAHSFGFVLDDSSRALRGALQILAPQAASWRPWQGRAPALPEVVTRAPVALQLRLERRLELSTASLRRLRTGGALLLGATQAGGWPCRLLWPGRALGWSAVLEGQRLTLRSSLGAKADAMPQTPQPTTPGSSTMDSLPTPSAGAAAAALDTMPVALEFHLGVVSMPLSELSAALAPGYVIELGRALGANSVSVRANGQLLAQGELVQVGDQLAVRISRIANDDGPV